MNSAYSTVPQELKNLPNWVVWQSPSKMPFNPLSQKKGAKSNDPDTWSTFSDAVNTEVLEGFSGIGFELRGTNLVGIDFDSAVMDGKADPYVLAILALLGNPYCELSPSGKGLHAFVECEKLPEGKRKFTNGSHEGIEIYHGNETAPYFTVTGSKFSGEGIPKIEDISTPYLLITQNLNKSFKKLWLGDLSDYKNDHSAADAALCWRLAQLLNRDAAKIETVFSASALGQRSKWTDRPKYRKATIDFVLRCKNEPTQGVSDSQIAEAPSVESDSDPEPEIVEEPLPEFPAITGSIADLADALCPDIPREFKIMAAVTRIGLAISGKVRLEGEPHLQPRFYTCFIAEPGRGKTAAIKETRLIGDGYREVPSIDSAPALVDTFAEGERRLLLSPDEAVDLFEKAKTSRDGRNSLFTELLKLFEDNTTGNRARRNDSPIEIHDAHLAILCGATPTGYDSMWTGSKGSSGGLQSRFIPIVTTAPRIPARQRPSDMARVNTAVGRIRQQIERCEPTLITMTPEAEETFKVWWESVPQEDKPGTVRAETLVERFLMVLAVTNDTDVIDAGLMSTGIAFGNYIIAVREACNPKDAHSWVQAFEQKIEQCHKRAGVPMTRDRCRKMVHPDRCPGGYGDFIRAYGNLVQAGRLTIQGKTERAPKYGLDT